jgi:hypothetical protein
MRKAMMAIATLVCALSFDVRAAAPSGLHLPKSTPYPDNDYECSIGVDLQPSKPAEQVETVVVGLTSESRNVERNCDDLVVSKELSRTTLEQLAQAASVQDRAPFLRLRFSGPAITCGADYFVHVCGKLRNGKLSHAEDWPSLVSASRYRRKLVRTPSGDVVADAIKRNWQVVGIDIERQTMVPTTVRRVFTRPERGIELQLSTHDTVAMERSRRVWVEELHRFVTADKLEVGQHLRDVDHGNVSISGIETTDRQHWPVIEVGAPGTLFVNRILTAGASKPTPSTAPALSTVDSPLTIEPWPQSYDCMLGVDLLVGSVPAGIRSVGLVMRPQHAKTQPGSRQPGSCESLAVEWPASLLSAIHATETPSSKQRARIGIELPANCDELLDVGLCGRGADGRLSPIGSLRTGLSGSACLVSGTQIATPNGERGIETLLPGDEVISHDLKHGQPLVAHVVRNRPIENRPTLEFALENGRRLTATPEHLVYDVASAAFVPASTLQVGMKLKGAGRILSIHALPPSRVWDLSLDEPHIYFANGVMVHNY